jgi:MFS family permease
MKIKAINEEKIYPYTKNQSLRKLNVSRKRSSIAEQVYKDDFGEGVEHCENYSVKKTHIAGVISFLMGFTQATIIYVMSSYFKMATGTESVGLFYFLAYSVVMIVLLNFSKVVRIIGKANAFYFSLFFKIAIIAMLMLSPVSFWIVIPLMFYLVFSALEWASLDVILECFSEDRRSGRIRGKHLTLLNAGFIFGPFLATRLLDRFDFDGIFLFLFIINSVILFISIFGFRSIEECSNGRVTVRELVKKVYLRKNIARIYYVSFILEFFYAIMVVYSPLYLRDLGFSWNEVGNIFTIMLIPFVLVQYPMGLMADKKIGEKEALIMSLIIMGISSAGVYFISGQSALIWSLVLFATRIGAALVEVLRDSYFYKRIDAQDVDLIHFFRTAMPLGYIMASLFSIAILAFFPLKTVFIVLAVIIFSALIPAFFLLDNKSERQIEFEKNNRL